MDTYTLRTGEVVEIRPIRADDGERLRASHARLSPESRYRRFLAAKPQLSAADARYFVDVDGSDHFALVATLDGEIIAVARFIRLPEEPDTAEFAIVVGDDHQRQGLAFALLSRLADAARARGIRRFRATMLSDNVAVRRLMAAVAEGRSREHCLAGPVSEVEIDLRAPAGEDGRVPAIIAGCAGS